MAEVVLSRITMFYGAQSVIPAPGIDLTVPSGKICVLVGPSGCGKSTTLRLIAGLERPTSGEISIGGDRVTDVAPAKRDIAMVFQNYALYPHLTVRQNLEFALRLRKMAPAEIARQIDAVAASLELTPLLHRLPKQLSGGQRQRVAMGRAIVRRPKVFLFDEPLSNLDAQLRVQVRREISTLLAELKTTSVYVTHDQTEAMTLGDLLVVLKGGVVQQIGTPLELYQKPRNRFVATFLGAPPMNIVAADIAEGAVQVGNSRLPTPRVAGDRAQILLGIRPHHIALNSAVRDGGSARSGATDLLVPGRVHSRELLGGEAFCEIKTDAGIFAVKVEPTKLPTVGELVQLALDSSALYWFDSSTELALSAE